MKNLELGLALLKLASRSQGLGHVMPTSEQVPKRPRELLTHTFHFHLRGMCEKHYKKGELVDIFKNTE